MKNFFKSLSNLEPFASELLENRGRNGSPLQVQIFDNTIAANSLEKCFNHFHTASRQDDD